MYLFKYLHKQCILFNLALCLSILYPYYANAQNNNEKRCSKSKLTEQYQKGLNNAIQTWLEKRSGNTISERGSRGEVRFTVPIVIHIIHKGEPIGTGVNISDEQIKKQIQSTNDDFLGDNNWEDTIAEFKPVVGFAGIKFVLAKQDPYGRPTTGVIRLNGKKDKWSSDDYDDFTSLSYWPPEDYINIWVLDVIDNDGTFAFSTFPKYQIDGMSATGFVLPFNFEGIFLDYKFFGTNKNNGNYDLAEDLDLGKTLTHELGHYFGLLHTWGDGSCDTDDYVSDTPLMFKQSNGGCNYEKNSCNSVDMIQNFMDYTNDICMTAFTKGQVSRMQAVINNSINRKSLLTSHALNDLVPIANKIGIIGKTVDSNCSSQYTLNYNLINVGTTQANNYAISISNNGNMLNEMSFSKIIAVNQSVNMEPMAIDLAPGKNIIVLKVTSINGNNVNITPGSTLTSIIYYSLASDLPYVEQDVNNITKWSKVGSWEVKNLQSDNTNIEALYANMTLGNYSNYELHSNSFDFDSSENTKVSFEYAYNNGNKPALTDLLSIWVISCTNNLLSSRIFVQYEKELITMDTDAPSKYNDWELISEKIPNAFNGHKVKIIVSAQNNNSGKLYVRNLKVQNILINALDTEPNYQKNIINKHLELYPNPIMGNFVFLKLKKNSLNYNTIKIINQYGVIVKTLIIKDSDNAEKYYVGDLEKGIYVASFCDDSNNNDESHFIRFIKF